MNDTLNYYEKNADSFTAGTQNVEFYDVQGRFIRHLPAGSRILDFGCGSGRDTKFFLEQGYQVDATDGSENLCRIAAEYAGIPVRQMLFSELAAEDEYDGVWACSSILHLPKAELEDVLRKIIRAMKDGGYLYTSFRYGTFEGLRGERHFTDFTEETFEIFLRAFPELQIMEEWTSMDVRPGREDVKWLSVILQKVNTD